MTRIHNVHRGQELGGDGTVLALSTALLCREAHQNVSVVHAAEPSRISRMQMRIRRSISLATSSSWVAITIVTLSAVRSRFKHCQTLL